MNFFKKLNRQSDENENDDLDTGYKDGYFKSSRRGQVDADDGDADDGRYHEPDFTGRREAPAREDTPAREEPARTETRSRGYVEPDYVPSGRDTDRDDGFRASARPQPAPVVVPEPEPEEEPETEETENAGTEFFIPSDPITCRETIVRKVMEDHVVVVSVINLERDEVTRLFDYIMGAMLVLNADITRVDKTTVVLVPEGVEFDVDNVDIPDDEESDEEPDEESEDEYEDEGEDEEEESDENEDEDFDEFADEENADEDECEDEYEDEENDEDASDEDLVGEEDADGDDPADV